MAQAEGCGIHGDANQALQLIGAATSSLTLVPGRPRFLIMLRRILMTVMAVVALAGVAWSVTRATTTEVTTVGVKIRRAPR